jgi:predicted acetyltransferase
MMQRFFTRKSLIKKISNEIITLKLVHKTKATIDPQWLPSLVYDIIRNEDKKAIGRCDLRIGMNDYMYYMGNIGYVIYPPYRGHRYATMATQLLFEIAKEFMSECIITCSPENIASIKTCEYSGCEFVEEIDVPKEHELIKQFEYVKRVYRKRLH